MKCPICGGVICAIDTLNTEYLNGSYYDTVEGDCPNCGNLWQWIEVFTFDHCENMELIEINDHL